MATIGLRGLWADDDGMIQVELFASNGRQSTTQDFYTYPQDIERFDRSLSAFFPKPGKGEVTFEYGAEGEGVYSFVGSKAFYISLHGIGVPIRTNHNLEGRESAARQRRVGKAKRAHADDDFRREIAQPIPRDAAVMTMPRCLTALCERDGLSGDPATLADFIITAARRLENRSRTREAVSI